MNPDNPVRQAALFNTWMHSYEEDTSTVHVFRVSKYLFPLSRGRSGFEIKNGGDFVLLTIAPTDGIEETEGHWQHDGKSTVNAQMVTGLALSLEIISLTADQMQVRRKPSSMTIW